MKKLTAEELETLHGLLDAHARVTEALANLPKAGFIAELDVSEETEYGYTTVRLDYDLAMKALTEQKSGIDAALTEFDIEIA